MTRLLRAGLSTCLLFSAGCDSGVENVQSLDDLFIPLAAATSQNLCQTTSRVPATAAGNALLWTLDTLNLFPEHASESTLLDRFDASVFDTSSASTLGGSLRTLGSDRPFAMAGFAELPTQSSISAVLASATSGYLKVTIETAENGRITVLHFEPFVAPEEAPDCPDVTTNEAAPVANTPPANAPPANAPPVNAPPANAPPANAPPANAPPANAPPANNPTGGQ